MDKRVYSLADVAEMTGWPQESIRRDCQKGRYAHIRRGRIYGMTNTQIEDMVAAHERGQRAQALNERDAQAAAVEAARQANIARLTRRGAA